jgi:hypothetical protein
MGSIPSALLFNQNQTPKTPKIMENSFAYLESIGKSKIWLAYAENFACDLIEAEGFNPNSGYVYLALESGITICSLLGADVEYLVYEHENGEELIFDSYQELEKYLNPEY